MGDPQTVFIIPTFQRPYAWIKKQLDDLQNDILQAHRLATSGSKGHHYFSPIHVVPLKPDDALQSGDWSTQLHQYLHDSDDLQGLRRSTNFGSFVDNLGNPLDVYLVIDGQQRLTTFYFLFHFLYRGSPVNPLSIVLPNGQSIPRLIQNPSNDHDYMKHLLHHVLTGSSAMSFPKAANTQAQKRMRNAIEHIEGWEISNRLGAFIRAINLKSIVITLEPEYGLTSFLTLNDRGKPLTVLEKFKALLLESDLYENGSKLAHTIHNTFGDLYLLLDQSADSGLFPEGEKGDEALVQCLSTYIRIGEDVNAPDQSAETAYQYFRTQLMASARAGQSGQLLHTWITSIDELRPQIRRLNEYLLCQVPAATSPSMICTKRTLQDDYNIVVRSLGLSFRSLSIRTSDSLEKKWTFDLSMTRATSGWHIFETNVNRFTLLLQAHGAKPLDDLAQQASLRQG